MFKKVTQSIVNQMDPGGDLVPVHSILDHEHFQPLCLVRRKRKTIFHPSPSYKPTWYRLDDVLLPGGDNQSTESLFPGGGARDSTQFTVTKNISDRVDGNFSLQVEAVSLQMKGAASLSKEWSIKLQKNNISVPQLEALATERKMNVRHSFIKQLQRTQQNLYVVHETIETLEETSYEESSEAEGNLMTQLYAKFSAKGIQRSKQSISIPKGCTLAFRPIQLAITDEPWGTAEFLSKNSTEGRKTEVLEKNTNTSLTYKQHMRFQTCKTSIFRLKNNHSDLDYFPKEKIATFVSDGSSRGKLRALEAEVKENCQIFSQLSSGLLLVFLKAFKAVMRDRNLFQELTHKMDAILDETDGCELKTECPDLKGLLSSLQCSPEHLPELAGAITYTLDAFDELTEDQLLLLLESLDKKIVSQQLTLVASILKHIEDGKRSLIAETSSRSFSQEEEGELTTAMVQMSGVTVQEDGSAVCTGEAFSAIGALYVSLYVLNLLSNAD